MPSFSRRAPVKIGPPFARPYAQTSTNSASNWISKRTRRGKVRKASSAHPRRVLKSWSSRPTRNSWFPAKSNAYSNRATLRDLFTEHDTRSTHPLRRNVSAASHGARIVFLNSQLSTINHQLIKQMAHQAIGMIETRGLVA